MRLILRSFLFVVLCLSAFAVENLQISSFNADSIGLPKGTPVAILPAGGFIRANSGLTNYIFGMLPSYKFLSERFLFFKCHLLCHHGRKVLAYETTQ